MIFQKLRQTLKLLPLLLVLISAVSCITLPFPPPHVELCGSSMEGDFLLCNDQRIVPDQSQDYSRELTKGDICTNLADYQALEEYVLMLRKQIQELRIKCK